MAQITADKSSLTSPDTVRGNAACVLGVALFALGFPVAEELLAHWGAISLITARTVLGCALLFPLWVIADGWTRVLAAPWMRGLGIGALGFGTGTVILLVVQDFTDPVTAVLAAATMPVSAVALEVLFDGRRLTAHFLLGMALVLAGGYLATGVSLHDGEYGWGIVLGLAASMLFAWGSRKTVKGLPEMTSFGQCTLTTIGAMVFCVATVIVFGLAGWPGTHVAPLGVAGWLQVLIYAWVSLAISQILWLKGVTWLGVGLASFHLNAAPFYVMLILLLMGGTWEWNKAIGAAILATGVIIAQRRRRLLT